MRANPTTATTWQATIRAIMTAATRGVKIRRISFTGSKLIRATRLAQWTLVQ